MLFRYPGAKNRGPVARALVDRIAALAPRRYAEPFAGSLGVLFGLLRRGVGVEECRVNDADEDIVGVWTAVLNDPDGLCEAVWLLKPTVPLFDGLIDGLRSGSIDPADRAAAKIAVHQWSYSGLGVMAGGPIGGRKSQDTAAYKIGCRWDPDRVCDEVRRLNRLMSSMKKVEFSSVDASVVIGGLDESWVAYVDPPYIGAGDALYEKKVDHAALAATLSTAECRWVLSYDDHEAVRATFRGFKVEEVGVRYTVSNPWVSGERASPLRKELVIAK